MAKAKADKPEKPARKPKAAKPKAAGKASPRPKAAPKAAKGPQMKDAPPIATGDKLAKDEVEKLIARYRGRPTKFEPWMCDAVIAYGRLGWSKASMCAELMISRQTIDNWMADHPEFLGAMEIALLLSQQWWEHKGQDNLVTTGFQGSVYSRSMSARFPQDWTERKDTNVNLTTQEDWLKKLAAAEAAGELAE